MNREEILAMKPGRELNTLIAEKVMGWKIQSYDDLPDVTPEPDWVSENVVFCSMSEWEPSTDISAAWEVLEKSRKSGEVSMWTDKNGKWACEIGYWIYDDCDNVPEAICKAALLAVMEE
ncbi:BC1872 family protein [Paenibacillus alkalitolerans]|uniref:BC1872 family protein n=1 Tax=Paenibacillus alkalitolerans TaxID=2799335 RepID=UPI0018F6DCBC|nr:hypothetical protein [Paenibacillus alkalitolerans]